MDCTDCGNIINFPQPLQTIHLNNYIEFIKVDSFYGPRNQFDMVNFTDNMTIKRTISKFNIFEKDYFIMVVKSISSKFVLLDSNFNNLIINKQTLFFINRDLPKRSKEELGVLLFNIWRSTISPKHSNDQYFLEPLQRFPYIMPSRNKIFR